VNGKADEGDVVIIERDLAAPTPLWRCYVTQPMGDGIYAYRPGDCWGRGPTVEDAIRRADSELVNCSLGALNVKNMRLTERPAAGWHDLDSKGHRLITVVP